MRGWWRLGVWIIAASLLAAGCVDSPDDVAPTTDAASTAVDLNGGVTALQRLRDLDAGGLSEVELALAELSAYLGTLPGAPVIGLDESLHSSVTLPVNKALFFRDQMTAEQRSGLDSALARHADPARVVAAYGADGDEIVPGGDVQGFAGEGVFAAEPIPVCPSGAPSADDAVTPLLQTWRQRFADAASTLAAEFPGDVDFVVLFANPAFVEGEAQATTYAGGREPGGDQYMEALRACFGVHDCYIVIDLAATEPETAKVLAAHEWFHCWHYDLVETQERWDARPWWVSEGLAEWVGERYADRRPPMVDSRWPDYFRLETVGEAGRYDLFASTSEYSAVGFWSHVANHTDLVSLIPSLLRELVTLDDEGMLASVASTIGEEATAAIAAAPTQRVDLGPQWTTSGPGMPGGSRAEPALDLREGAPMQLLAEPGVQLANEVTIDVSAGDPHVVFTVLKNFGILEWSDGLTSTALSGDELSESRCLGSCVCPDGSTVDTTLPDIESTGAGFVVALSGVLPPGAALDATVAPLEDFCEEEPVEASPPPVRDPERGGSYGHPNLVTFDGVGYVFHGAGDYVILESATDNLAIHARYSRLSNMTGVSYNRAVAAQVGTSVVTFGDDAASTAFDPAVVRIDGVVVQPATAPLDVGGGARLELVDERYVLTWSDGTELRVGTRIGDQFDVLVPEERWGKVVGLLGDADGDPLLDVVTRSGEPVDPNQFDSFYATFGASWLLDPLASLFESELDPADIEPIVPSAQVTLADLSPAVRADAEATCRAGGVAPAFGLSQCIFDVAMTGDSSWIRGVLAMREVIDHGVSVSAQTADIEDERAIDGDGTYAGDLSERFAVDVFTVDLTVGGSLLVTARACPEIPTFEVALVSPSGFVLDRSRGDDCGELALRRVAEPGEYRIAVYDTGGFAGAYSLELGVTELGDGDQVTFDVPFDIVVGEPGVDPSITFDARAGDRLTFTHPVNVEQNGNLGFAFYRLLGPDGTVVESWPAREDGTATIVVDGTYTLLVDVVVGIEAGSVTITISNDPAGAPISARIGQPFTMEVAEPGGISLATFDAEAGDRLLIESEVPDVYFEAAATFRIVGPEGNELAWWFSFRTGDIEVPASGRYTLSFDPGNTDEISSFAVVIQRQ